MTRRWIVERKAETLERDQLQIIEVYKEDENKEIVKKENSQWTHKRIMLILDA